VDEDNRGSMHDQAFRTGRTIRRGPTALLQDRPAIARRKQSDDCMRQAAVGRVSRRHVTDVREAMAEEQ
jgi:hypothetical protein